MKNIHPGEVLRKEFLDVLGITPYRLSKETLIPQTALSLILKEKRAITVKTAIKFSTYFKNTPKFWLGLQNDYDIERLTKKK